ncbi:MAG: hypothetical protein CFE24_12735 [Flavobacterium sp. BFFFF2]|nr:MAG: hypothetical protein CFE24_12735 [Flavobacterium sp. BFFFF2]
MKAKSSPFASSGARSFAFYESKIQSVRKFGDKSNFKPRLRIRLCNETNTYKKFAFANSN